MSQPSVLAKGQCVPTKLRKGLTTAKTQQSEVNDRAETYQANGSRLCCLVLPDDVHRLVVILSLTVSATKGPCLSFWTAKSLWSFSDMKLMFFLVS